MIYLAILLGLLGCMALVDAKWKLLVFRYPLRGLMVLVLGTGFFVLWDVLAIGQGIFLHKPSQLMTGVMVGDQFPLEELFFLVFLCYCAMIAVTGAQALLRFRARRSSGSPKPGEGDGHVS